jgi:hypothetical protein
VRALLLVAIAFIILFGTSCSGVLPKLSLTPVSVDSQMGGVRETAVEEDNMVKVSNGDTTTSKYEADTVEQVYNDIQEYPTWLVLAFAFAVGMAIPSPIAAYGSWRQRKIMQKQIAFLSKLLAASKPNAEITNEEKIVWRS